MSPSSNTCACGCGATVAAGRRFVWGHNLRGRPLPPEAHRKRWDTRGRLDRTPVPCACGCGTLIEPADKDGHRRRYVSGHNGRGRPRSPETRAKISAGHVARRPADWVPYRTAARYRDPRYQEWRLAVLERDKWTCQHCGHVARRRERHFAAHHIKPYSTFPTLRYDVDNGIALCRDCHRRVHAIWTRDRAQVPCACGCGTLIWSVNDWGERRRYVNGHQWRGRKRPGRLVTEQTREKQRASMLAYWRRGGHDPHPQTEQTRAKISATLRARHATAEPARPPAPPADQRPE